MINPNVELAGRRARMDMAIATPSNDGMSPELAKILAAAEADMKSFRGSYLLYRKAGAKLRRGGGGNPRFRHPNREAAETEAKRLLGLFPESTFVILQEVGRVKLKVPSDG